MVLASICNNLSGIDRISLAIWTTVRFDYCGVLRFFIMYCFVSFALVHNNFVLLVRFVCMEHFSFRRLWICYESEVNLEVVIVVKEFNFYHY